MRNYKIIFSMIMKRGSHLIGLMPIFFLAFTVLAIPLGASGTMKQPKQVKFSHQLHVTESGIACLDCHSEAAQSTKASDNLLAKMEACKNCHEEQEKNNCAYCHMSVDSSSYSASPNPIRELRFSHQQHVDSQKVACETCHKILDKEDASVGELVPAMTICATCHNDVKASGACEKCHTNLAALRPSEHNRTDFMHEHKHLAQSGNATCGACHTQESCFDCHNGSALVKVDVPGRDLMSQHLPQLTANDRGEGMVLTKVHDLNFRFTHGIAAKGKTMECQTCHSNEQFCTPCHEAGGNVNQSSFKPASHLVGGFTTLGVGSGGGEHARLAKRDIESCAGCHSPEGADPICIACHSDPDGIKGNNPKTHDPGFMSGNHGYWHNDPGAICYMCHTDINAHPGGVKGQGFCRYCHIN